MSKIKIKCSELFKELSYCLAVVFNSGLSNFAENVGLKISLIILLQCKNQEFNIQIYSGMNQIMSLSNDPIHFRDFLSWEHNINLIRLEISITYIFKTCPVFIYDIYVLNKYCTFQSMFFMNLTMVL